MSPIGGPDDASPATYDVDEWKVIPVVGEGAPVVDLCADRDRVIARLLDGWRPQLANRAWISFGRNVLDEMSDGEAAIIRQHQEKT